MASFERKTALWIVATALVATALGTLLACSESAAPPTVAFVRVLPLVDTLPVGKSYQLSAAALDGNGRPLPGVAIRWVTDNGYIATISPSGMVTGRGLGITRIEAVSDGKTGSATVLVVPPPVASVEVNADSNVMFVGQTRRLTVTLRDEQGNVLGGRQVDWESTDSAVAIATDSGDVHVFEAGEATIIAISEGVTGSMSLRFELPVIVQGKIYPLKFKTYDRSRQVVHPDLVYFPGGWNGRPYWAAITPYPGGNSAFENPSVFSSRNGVSWHPPRGLKNPVVRPSGGYLSDPDLLFHAETNELWLYYRQTSGGRDDILLTRSADGVTWSPSVPVFGSAGYSHISPAFVRTPTGGWRSWYVNAGTVGCTAAATAVMTRESADGLAWSEGRAVELAQPGSVVWHIDIQYVASKDEYWAVYAAYPQGSSCGRSELFFARSIDGLSWRAYPSPMLQRQEIPQFADVVYRSTFIYDDASDLLTVWYSGSRYTPGGQQWSAAIGKRQYAELLQKVTAPAPLRAAENRVYAGSGAVPFQAP
ncbi:MAG: Ig-like domain-containing protein [Gemmatimonadota bacterium]|nr:Ig-like domain-containing protein [Gemmatimonadota bacterium]MDQ6888424.1 Ig-like domain-containing protein [Gemmatimonadota bacterium]